MDSKIENMMLAAIDHFKEGQLAAWMGDEEKSAFEFEKCIHITDELEKMGFGQVLNDLAKLAKHTPRKLGLRIKDVYNIKRENVGKDLSFSIIPLGYNRAEFRGRTFKSSDELVALANSILEVPHQANLVNDRSWQWIEINEQDGFTGSFHLSFSDGTIYGQIISHRFLHDDQFNQLSQVVADSIIKKLKNY